MEDNCKQSRRDPVDTVLEGTPFKKKKSFDPHFNDETKDKVSHLTAVRHSPLDDFIHDFTPATGDGK